MHRNCSAFVECQAHPACAFSLLAPPGLGTLQGSKVSRSTDVSGGDRWCVCCCRSVAPTEELDASQEDIFREVIPDGSAKALSRYTDAVDALIREQNDRLAGASDDARLRLREADLPDCLQVRCPACPCFLSCTVFDDQGLFEHRTSVSPVQDRIVRVPVGALFEPGALCTCRHCI